MTDRQAEFRALRRFLADQGLLDDADAAVRQIGEGHSNLIYLVDDGRSQVVVRRPPQPPYPPGAHDVVREARIQRALAGTRVPVPYVLAVQEDTSTIGVPFYVMAHLAGEVLTTSTPDGLDTPTERRAIAEALVDTLAAMHQLDPVTLGLVETAPLAKSAAATFPRLARLLQSDSEELDGQLGSIQRALLESAPPASAVTLTHGDFRPGNVMLGVGPPARVLAVLDWELAGLGHPLMDLGYFLASYARPHEPLHAITAVGRATCADGYPEREELAARYAEATGTDTSGISWFMAASLWKLAVLFEYQRRRLLTGSGDPFYGQPGLVDGLALAAENLLEGERV